MAQDLTVPRDSLGTHTFASSRARSRWARPTPIAQLLRLFPDTKREWFTDEQPPHRVRITKPFYLGAHQVTVGQFRRFVNEFRYRTEAEKDGKGGYGWDEAQGTFVQDPKFTWLNPGFPQTDEHPVVIVSWNDANSFCDWLTKADGGRLRYRLPTEAEWEYACRAGSTTLFPNGDDPEGLATIGNVADATRKRKFPDWTTIQADDGYVYTAPVGSYQASPWHLYDMIGNVWEWCQDGYDADYYKKSPQVDPSGPPEAPSRVIRGGGWFREPGYCRPANRGRRRGRAGTAAWASGWPQSRLIERRLSRPETYLQFGHSRPVFSAKCSGSS